MPNIHAVITTAPIVIHNVLSLPSSVPVHFDESTLARLTEKNPWELGWDALVAIGTIFLAWETRSATRLASKTEGDKYSRERDGILRPLRSELQGIISTINFLTSSSVGTVIGSLREKSYTMESQIASFGNLCLDDETQKFINDREFAGMQSLVFQRQHKNDELVKNLQARKDEETYMIHYFYDILLATKQPIDYIGTDSLNSMYSSCLYRTKNLVDKYPKES